MKITLNNIFLFGICTLLLSGCGAGFQRTTKLPTLSMASYMDLKLENEEEFKIKLVNHIPVERYVILRSEIDSVQHSLDRFNPILLNPEDSVSYVMFGGVDSLAYKEIAASISGNIYVGNPNTVQPDSSYLYELPVQKGKRYRILQGQGGTFTHNKTDNKYAVDFAMSVGDTVFAARGGFVAYVFEESSYGGNNIAYLNYANAVMIHHEDGTVAQYFHLKKDGALVEIGDTVSTGQPIALSGNTGFVSGDHLHFNVSMPTQGEPVSLFVSFKGYEGRQFKKGDTVVH